MRKDKGENYSSIYGIPEYEEWSEEKEYKHYERVRYKGAIYAARTSNIGVNPFFDDGTTWELIGGYAFEDGDTMEVEKSNGLLISARKVNASGGVGSNVTSKGLNIYGIKASKESYGVVKAGEGINISDGVISSSAGDKWQDVTKSYNVTDLYPNYCTTKIYRSSLFYLVVVSMTGNYGMASGEVISNFDRLGNAISVSALSIGCANNYDSPSATPNAALRFSNNKIRVTAQTSFPTTTDSSLYFILPIIEGV